MLQVVYFFYTKIIGSINGDLSLILESIAFSLPSTLALLGTGYLVNKILIKEKIDSAVRKTTIYALMLGTILFTYSVSYFKHNLSTFFIISTLYFYLYSKNKHRYLLTSLFLGLSTLCELPTVLLIIPILLNEFILNYKQKKIFLNKILVVNSLKLTAFLGISIIALGVFQYFHFGNFFTTGDHLYQQGLINKGFNPIGFNQNIFLGLYGYLFSPIKGLFLISPFLIFSIPAFINKKLHYSKKFVMTGYTLIVLGLYSMWSDCFGASPFGPRHISTIIPILAILSAVTIAKKSKKYFFIYKILVIFSCTFILVNSVDGIPSGKYAACQINDFVGHKKVINRIIDVNKKPSPILLRLLINKEVY